MNLSIPMLIKRSPRLVVFLAFAPCIGVSTAFSNVDTPPAAESVPQSAASPSVPSSDETSFLYGVEFGRQLRALGIADRLSMEDIKRGLKGGLDGTQSTTPGNVQQAQVFLHSLKEPADSHGAAAQTAGAPSIEEGSALYGVNFGEALRHMGIADQVSLEAVARGIKEGMSGAKTTTAEDRQRMALFVRSVREAKVSANKAAAQEFFARNSHEKGVKTTASGLQYKVVTTGDRKAQSPKATDLVTVQYRGKLLDGSEFDSSSAHGGPSSFAVNGLIKGWQEALVLMKPGAKWQLFVPPELGYGDSQQPRIPGGSVLIFDIELLSVNARENAALRSPNRTTPGGENTVR